MAFSPVAARRAAIPLATVALTAAVVPAGATQTAPNPTPTSDQTAAQPKQVRPSKAQIRAERRAQARARADRQRASLVRVALSKKHAGYVAGAAGPGAFDCSGFVMWVYRKATGKSLPHYSGAQMDRARHVSQHNLKPGDLLFYGPGGSQHVSMYIGKGRMIHATNPSSGVRIDSIRMGYYRARFAGAGRIIGH